jgi:hypothetical protein
VQAPSPLTIWLLPSCGSSDCDRYSSGVIGSAARGTPAAAAPLVLALDATSMPC